MLSHSGFERRRRTVVLIAVFGIIIASNGTFDIVNGGFERKTDHEQVKGNIKCSKINAIHCNIFHAENIPLYYCM